MEYVASISYGKDSLAMLYVITDVLGWQLDRIITADVWATDTIPADLPPMVEFKDKADKIIKDRWGIEVEHFYATRSDGTKISYKDVFYSIRKKGYRKGEICGFPFPNTPECNGLKRDVFKRLQKELGSSVEYIGIALDEPLRIKKHINNPQQSMPLVKAQWTEQMCRDWCEANGLLSPIYTQMARGGCWFCHNQSINQLRLLRKQYPEYWQTLLEWDSDSPVAFKSDGRTVHDFDKRFQLEDEGFQIDRFRWSDLDHPQMNLMQIIERCKDEH